MEKNCMVTLIEPEKEFDKIQYQFMKINLAIQE